MGVFDSFKNMFGDDKNSRRERRRVKRKINRKIKELKKQISEVEVEANKFWEKAANLKKKGRERQAKRALKNYQSKLNIIEERLRPALSTFEQVKNQYIVGSTFEEIQGVIGDISEMLEIDIESLEDMEFELEEIMADLNEAGEIFDHVREEQEERAEYSQIPDLDQLDDELEQEITQDVSTVEEEEEIKIEEEIKKENQNLKDMKNLMGEENE